MEEVRHLQSVAGEIIAVENYSDEDIRVFASIITADVIDYKNPMLQKYVNLEDCLRILKVIPSKEK